jgi:oxalate decarboxylase/phosphoglucose isomerase-like protein (cupin superfamily)
VANVADRSADLLSKVAMSDDSPYDMWIETLGVPIHRGYYVDDVRTLELGWWEERQCNAAILKLVGQEGVAESRVTEIPGGGTLPPYHFAFDEVVYVADGRGLTTVTNSDGTSSTFEWQKHSLFMLPRNTTHQMSNAQGNAPARLLHYNYLPTAMSLVPDPDFFFDSNYPTRLPGDEDKGFYSEAKVIQMNESRMAYWLGNFFPDMRAWDRLAPFRGRGAGGHVVWIRFPGSAMTNHMSVFPSRTYKKGHRHGPGVMIVIPSGEGYSVMWPEGGEKVIVPWHEGSVFVPPNQWYHQHFNLGGEPARYLAFHSPRSVDAENSRIDETLATRQQIEYPNEEPSVRQRFESELAKRNLTSLMPEEAYQRAEFEWEYEGKSA